MPIGIAIGTSLKMNVLETYLYIPNIEGYFFYFFSVQHYIIIPNMSIDFLNKDTFSQKKKKSMETRMTSNNPSSIIYCYVLKITNPIN